eukprot:TRINITY_DN801_c0_g2_i1.p1 TRINITY_DN801_c0_g2~~TRINITY_DN801_c0_g2_i1.p1  ORF type:complete len:1102 (+),score=273.57 TRINITY_DN801_c0_g2_i1:59-3307(+)
MPLGKVKRWLGEYGFIEPVSGGGDVFFHCRHLTPQYLKVQEGLPVEFEIDRGSQRRRASFVRLAPVTPGSPAAAGERESLSRTRSRTRLPRFESTDSSSPCPRFSTQRSGSPSSQCSDTSSGTTCIDLGCNGTILGCEELTRRCQSSNVAARLRKCGQHRVMLDLRGCCAGQPGLRAVAALARDYPGVSVVRCSENRGTQWCRGVAEIVGALRSGRRRCPLAVVEVGALADVEALQLANAVLDALKAAGMGEWTPVAVRSSDDIPSGSLADCVTVPLPASLLDFSLRVCSESAVAQAVPLFRSLAPYLGGIREFHFAARIPLRVCRQLCNALPRGVTGISCPPPTSSGECEGVIAAVETLRMRSGGTVSCDGNLSHLALLHLAAALNQAKLAKGAKVEVWALGDGIDTREVQPGLRIPVPSGQLVLGRDVASAESVKVVASLLNRLDQGNWCPAATCSSVRIALPVPPLTATDVVRVVRMLGISEIHVAGRARKGEDCPSAIQAWPRRLAEFVSTLQGVRGVAASWKVHVASLPDVDAFALAAELVRRPAVDDPIPVLVSSPSTSCIDTDLLHGRSSPLPRAGRIDLSRALTQDADARCFAANVEAVSAAVPGSCMPSCQELVIMDLSGCHFGSGFGSVAKVLPLLCCDGCDVYLRHVREKGWQQGIAQLAAAARFVGGGDVCVGTVSSRDVHELALALEAAPAAGDGDTDVTLVVAYTDHLRPHTESLLQELVFSHQFSFCNIRACSGRAVIPPFPDDGIRAATETVVVNVPQCETVQRRVRQWIEAAPAISSVDFNCSCSCAESISAVLKAALRHPSVLRIAAKPGAYFLSALVQVEPEIRAASAVRVLHIHSQMQRSTFRLLWTCLQLPQLRHVLITGNCDAAEVTAGLLEFGDKIRSGSHNLTTIALQCKGKVAVASCSAPWVDVQWFYGQEARVEWTRLKEPVCDAAAAQQPPAAPSPAGCPSTATGCTGLFALRLRLLRGASSEWEESQHTAEVASIVSRVSGISVGQVVDFLASHGVRQQIRDRFAEHKVDGNRFIELQDDFNPLQIELSAGDVDALRRSFESMISNCQDGFSDM